MYKVSLIIPVYNVECYIQSALLSALSQTFLSVEYILIDDCGQDNSMALVQKTLSEHPRKKDVFIYKHNKNLGLSAARNTGLKKAHGEYVYFMDSDDEITEDCIEKLYQAISDSDADWAMGNIELQGVSSRHIRTMCERQLNDEEILLSFLKKEWLEAAWNKLLRRTFLIENELTFVSGLLHEDILWAYHLAKASKRMIIISEKSYVYKIREGSITSSKVKKRVDSFITILGELYLDYNTVPFKKEFSAFFSSLQFVASLLITSSGMPFIEKKSLYNNVNAWTLPSTGLQSRFLKLPYGIFQLSLALPYKIYKEFR